MNPFFKIMILFDKEIPSSNKWVPLSVKEIVVAVKDADIIAFFEKNMVDEKTKKKLLLSLLYMCFFITPCIKSKEDENYEIGNMVLHKGWVPKKEVPYFSYFTDKEEFDDHVRGIKKCKKYHLELENSYKTSDPSVELFSSTESFISIFSEENNAEDSSN